MNKRMKCKWSKRWGLGSSGLPQNMQIQNANKQEIKIQHWKSGLVAPTVATIANEDAITSSVGTIAKFNI